LAERQGDQIAQFFCFFILILGSVANYIQNWPTVLGYFFHGKSVALILAEYGLGYILGDFFTNSSGHPAERILTKT
jgi:hypothetical protein